MCVYDGVEQVVYSAALGVECDTEVRCVIRQATQVAVRTKFCHYKFSL